MCRQKENKKDPAHNVSTDGIQRNSGQHKDKPIQTRRTQSTKDRESSPQGSTIQSTSKRELFLFSFCSDKQMSFLFGSLREKPKRGERQGRERGREAVV